MRDVCLLLILFACAALANPELDRDFPHSDIVISAARACHHFDVYLAINNEQRRRGLMHVRSLAAHQGMLFVYPNDGEYAMWMKNTFIPLDIVFIRADGSVSSVIANAEPQSLKTLPSVEPVRYVLELNGGSAARFGIAAGSHVQWSGDVNEPSEH